MNYKLLVLDIDGTVTNSDKKVLEKTRKAIIGLQEKGVSVAIASGRAPKGVFSIAKGWSFIASETIYSHLTELKSLISRPGNVFTKNIFPFTFQVGSGKTLWNISLVYLRIPMTF